MAVCPRKGSDNTVVVSINSLFYNKSATVELFPRKFNYIIPQLSENEGAASSGAISFHSPTCQDLHPSQANHRNIKLCIPFTPSFPPIQQYQVAPGVEKNPALVNIYLLQTLLVVTAVNSPCWCCNVVFQQLLSRRK